MKKLLVSATIALMLLTATAAFAASTAAEKELLLKGSIQSLETYVVQFPTMSVTASGSGTATQLGRFTVTYGVEVNLVTNEGTGGSAQFVASNGDSIFAEGGGQATPTATPGVFNIVEHYTITGGTGRFAGASGSITLDRLVDINTGETSGGINGMIVLP